MTFRASTWPRNRCKLGLQEASVISGCQCPSYRCAGHGFQFETAYFYRHRPLDQFEGNHKTAAVFPAQDDSFQALEWPAHHSNAPTDLQVRMRLGTKPLAEELSDARHFLLQQRDGVAVETDEPDNARNLQDAKAILQRQVDKDIAGEKGQLETHLAVFPPAHRLVLGEEMFDSAVRKLIRDPVLMVCASVDGIPVRKKVRGPLQIVSDYWCLLSRR